MTGCMSNRLITRLFFRLASLAWASLLLVPSAAADDSALTRLEPADRSTSRLTLLPRTPVVGTTLYGSANLSTLNASARQRFETAADSGLSGFTLYLDWPDLESAPGQLDADALLSQLDPLADRHLHVFVNITVGNIGQYNVPMDLSDGDGGLAAGVKLNDPDVLARFLGLMDQLVPLLGERGVFLLGLGNEIDERLDLASDDELIAYTEFVAAVRAHVQTLEPDLPIAVTLTSSAVREQTPTWQLMQAVSDHVAINYAPIDSDWRVLTVDEIADDLDNVLEAFGDQPLIVQELTCPSAASMGASTWWQAQCLAIVLDRFGSHRQTRFISLFSLEDLDETTCEAVQTVFAPLLIDAPADFRERFGEYLCRLGLLNPDGEPKPAWSIVLDRLAGATDNQPRSLLLEQQAGPAKRRLLLRPPPSGQHEIALPLTASTGEQRRYQVHIPTQRPPPGGWPMVVHFHGGGGSGDSARAESRWDELAERRNFVVVFAEGTRPDPTSPPGFGTNPQSWNDGTGRSAIGAVARGEDDLGYVNALLDDLANRVPISDSQVYATGFSNGASLSLHLARNLPERLAAVAAVAGKDVETPLPDSDALPSILYMTGTEDPLNPLAGGNVFLFGTFLGNFPPIETLLARWRVGLNCQAAPTFIEPQATDTEARRHFPCRSNATAEFWLLAGHGHHWPGGDSPLPETFWTGPNVSALDATEIIWSFFAQSRKVRTQ